MNGTKYLLTFKSKDNTYEHLTEAGTIMLGKGKIYGVPCFSISFDEFRVLIAQKFKKLVDTDNTIAVIVDDDIDSIIDDIDTFVMADIVCNLIRNNKRITRNRVIDAVSMYMFTDLLDSYYDDEDE